MCQISLSFYEILKAGAIGVVWVAGKDKVYWADGAGRGVLTVVGITVVGSIPETIKFILYFIIIFLRVN